MGPLFLAFSKLGIYISLVTTWDRFLSLNHVLYIPVVGGLDVILKFQMDQNKTQGMLYAPDEDGADLESTQNLRDFTTWNMHRPPTNTQNTQRLN